MSHWQEDKHGRTFLVSITFFAFPRLLFLSLPYFSPRGISSKALKTKEVCVILSMVGK